MPDVYWCGRGRWPLTAAGVLVLGLAGGCGLVGGTATFQPDIITVTSPVLGRGAIPARYTCRGAGVSPPLHWSGAPEGTESLALVVDDGATPITPYIYWIVFNINPATTGIQEGRLPYGARQAQNSAGRAAYQPPCPQNEDRSYRFTVYALRSVLSLRNGVGLRSAWMAIARSAIARGRLTATAVR